MLATEIVREPSLGAEQLRGGEWWLAHCVIPLRNDAAQVKPTPGIVRYFGIWNLHPVGLAGPSTDYVSIVDIVAAALDGSAHQLMVVIGHETDAGQQLRAYTFLEHEPADSVSIGDFAGTSFQEITYHAARRDYLPQKADVRPTDRQANTEDGNS